MFYSISEGPRSSHLHSHRAQQSQKKCQNQVTKFYCSLLKLTYSSFSPRGCLCERHTNTLHRETHFYLSHAIWSVKTVLRYLFLDHCNTQMVSLLQLSCIPLTCLCVQVFVCVVCTLGALLQNVLFLNPHLCVWIHLKPVTKTLKPTPPKKIKK